MNVIVIENLGEIGQLLDKFAAYFQGINTWNFINFGIISFNKTINHSIIQKIFESVENILKLISTKIC